MWNFLNENHHSFLKLKKYTGIQETVIMPDSEPGKSRPRVKPKRMGSESSKFDSRDINRNVLKNQWKGTKCCKPRSMEGFSAILKWPQEKLS